ncbi:hypothetical protein IAU59_005194 [Kwoniella sp. CBS 9459]
MPTIPPFLAPYLEQYPAQAGPLLTAVYDLTLSVGWIDTRITSLGGWVVLVGHKREDDPLRAVIPLPIHTTSLRPSSLRAIFNALSSTSLEDLPPPFEPLAPTVDELREKLSSVGSNSGPGLGSTSTSTLTSGEDRTEDIVATSAATAGEPVLNEESQTTTTSTSTSTPTAEISSSDPGLGLGLGLDKETIYTAIVTPDSTVVYYKLSKGIKKPADIPDE